MYLYPGGKAWCWLAIHQRLYREPSKIKGDALNQVLFSFFIWKFCSTSLGWESEILRNIHKHSHSCTRVQSWAQTWHYPRGSPQVSVVTEPLGNSVVILVPPVITPSQTDSKISQCRAHSCAWADCNARTLSLGCDHMECVWSPTVGLKYGNN